MEIDEIVVRDKKIGDMFRILSGNREYGVAVSRPERNEVAMVAAGEAVPINSSIFKIVGAGLHGKVENRGCIALSSRLYLKEVSGDEVVEMAPVKYISPISHWVNASPMQIIVSADRNIAETLDIYIKQFPEKERQLVRGVVYCFGNYGGRIAAIKALRAADEKGKLKRALKIFGLSWKVAVRNQSPLFVGDPEHEKSMECWKYFCQNIGIPLPFPV